LVRPGIFSTMKHVANEPDSLPAAGSNQGCLSESGAEPVVYCIAMIRNDADIVQNFLQQALVLFDKTMVVDIQSVDGTKEIIEEFESCSNGRIIGFSCNTRERYQSALMNLLARKAFSEGADWVFLLDADEFLDMESREQLHGFLKKCGDLVIHLPWINLIPSRYGSFARFDAGQVYTADAQPAPVQKVAISSRYALINPDFYIEEGNHNVSESVENPPELERFAFPILHIPVRSAERLQYKLSNASLLLDSKHNTRSDEGDHVGTILGRLKEAKLTPALLDSIASTYSVKPETQKRETKKSASPEKAPLIRRQLPSYVLNVQKPLDHARSLTETFTLDAEQQWDHVKFVKGAPVCAELKDRNIQIRALPMTGRGQAFYGRYSALSAENARLPTGLNVQVFTDAVAATFSDVELTPELEWTGLSPVLSALFSLLRPRRYVQLGVGSGISFFAACEASKKLELATQCVGLDAWIGPRAEPQPDQAFKTFRSQLKARFPTQHFIRGRFADGLTCFDAGSIDLLYFDSDQSYGAVVEDFSSWLPRMSRIGTMIFHDVNVHRAGGGLWRLWDELKRAYPAYTFYHCGGLGVLYVGEKSSAISQAIEALNANGGYARLAQLFFAYLGENISNKKLALEAANKVDDDQTGLKLLLSSDRIAHRFRRVLRSALLFARIKYSLSFTSTKRRARYTRKKREIKDSIAVLNRRLAAIQLEKRTVRNQRMSKLAHSFSMSPSHADGLAERTGQFVSFDQRRSPEGITGGLHKDVRLVIPTRGCSKWLPYFLNAYRSWGLEPTYAVDNGCEPATLRLLKENNVSTVFIDSDQIPNGESIMPYLSKSIQEEYIFRLDDDEFPARELIEWVNSIPDSDYAFVTSWWIPRYEVAFLDGRLQSCHPKWFRTKVGASLYYNLQGGRFYRHRDVTYDKVGPHHGNFISDYVSHAPPDALLIHLDYLVRTMEERLNKLRSTEMRFKDAGWPFANHMLPEMAPRELLSPKAFDNPDLKPLIDELLEKVYQPTDKLTLGVDEIVAIQKDRLSHDTMHFHY
jgi:Methyltransferase domain/Glycosyl transferase family 2